MSLDSPFRQNFLDSSSTRHQLLLPLLKRLESLHHTPTHFNQHTCCNTNTNTLSEWLTPSCRDEISGNCENLLTPSFSFSVPCFSRCHVSLNSSWEVGVRSPGGGKAC
eukprot:RCo032882